MGNLFIIILIFATLFETVMLIALIATSCCLVMFAISLPLVVREVIVMLTLPGLTNTEGVSIVELPVLPVVPDVEDETLAIRLELVVADE